MNNANIGQRDLSVLWHTCTQMKDREWLPMIPVKRRERLGTLAVGGVALAKETHEPLPLEPIMVERPDCRVRAPGESEDIELFADVAWEAIELAVLTG